MPLCLIGVNSSANLRLRSVPIGQTIGNLCAMDLAQEASDADYSATFHKVRSTLTGANLRYLDFVRSLRPNYRKVLLDIALGHAMLVVAMLAVVALAALGVHPLVASLIGAILVGYWIAYLQLFLHEGAHYNLAPDRVRSDLFCDFAVGWLVGTAVSQYRTVHFQHHRALGTVDDTEISYFFPLNTLFLLKSLVGWRVLEVFALRARYLQGVPQRKKSSGSPRRGLVPLAGIAIHLSIVAGTYLIAGWPTALAWVIGVGIAFPFFGALRQTLEHRDENAPADRDFRKTNHGAYTRVFGDGPFASTFGGAGFNRHLLHHWEPQVSYTNLRALEAFLMETEMSSIIELRRSKYRTTLLKLLSL